ncbi:hypothetical protein ASG89_09440 [Paenibacillus sp. Soil766]|uniref:ABC transporter permease n=1 Tax=Paenibacillus sp. Soil766 TaxID=1736404 RepID=UPI00071075F9|nr:ABC transporter permease [Paenibacillus sp. Soil766]KRE90499.1 hypothetical protein ASG89_09440 [Paenibacillus sp. Soil766]
MQMWTIAIYEIHRKLRMRYVFLIQLLMPLMLIFILGSALSGAFKTEDKTPSPVKVDLVQDDTGALRESFLGFLATPEINKLIQTNVISTREEAVKRLRDGESEFALLIPSDFSSQVTSGNASQWEMILGKDYLSNLTAQMVFRSFLDDVNHKQAIAMMANAYASSQIQNPTSAASTEKLTTSDSFVQVGKLAASNANYTAMQYYAASMLIMFLLYSGMIAAFSLQDEKEKHTLSRLNAMPIQQYHILVGKILGNIVISIGQVVVIVGATKLFYGVDWGSNFLLLFLISLCIITTSMSLAIVVMLLSKSNKSISTTFQSVIMIMTFLSGGFTPLPDGFVKQLGSFTLNYWGMQSMFHLMLGSEAGIVSHHILILACISLGMLGLGLLLYRKGGYHE